jgi:hypothetical protein
MFKNNSMEKQHIINFSKNQVYFRTGAELNEKVV